MQSLVIAPQQEGKGRAFQALLLSYVLADRLWFGGDSATDVGRPVWMMLAGTDQELRPFIANLRLGRKADVLTRTSYRRRGGEKFEMLKSAGYQYAWQRTAHGSVVTAYLPDLFRLDPGMVDPKGVDFCILPTVTWAATQNLDTSAAIEHMTKFSPHPEAVARMAEMATLAPLFMGYLDRRTRCPLIPDPKFYLQVLCFALHEGLASWSNGESRYDKKWGQNDPTFEEYSTSTVGLLPGIVFKATHEDLELFLAEQVKLFFSKVYFSKDGLSGKV